MNYHSDEWIMDGVSEHLNEIYVVYPKDHIVGIFLQGSQNYGLDYKDSDIDTKCIITPSFRNVALVGKPVSTTHVRENDEHTDVKDIRLYIQTFRKQNLNFLEILFTKYFILPNKEFEVQWNRLVDNREKIAHFDVCKNVKAMCGVAAEKYFAMEHKYPSRMEWVNKFGYDPKQLHHLIRVKEYLLKYINGDRYEDCMVTSQADFLKSVKTGLYSLEEARKLGTDTYNEIKEVSDKFCQINKGRSVDKEVDELLDDVSYEIMKISIKQDFEKECAVNSEK
jgi:predicted nucleotidyltransferase